MTNNPVDLLDFRRRTQAVTGLADPADVGIAGDGLHQRTGGYHEGRDVLAAIGRYHPGALAGSAGEDYSARLARDRAGLTDDASAVDVAAGWPHGGRPAWLRWNNLLVAALHAGDPALATIRAINYSPDGTARRRIDREHGWTVEDSTDSVDIHTHLEWYRDTAGHRQPSFDRLIALAQAAIGNLPAPLGGDRMIVMAHEKGSNIDWVGDGLFRYRVPDADHRANAFVVMRLQGNPNPASAEFNPGTLDALGPIVVTAAGGVPTAAAALTEADRQAIVAGLNTQLFAELAPLLTDLRIRLAAAARAEADALGQA